VLAGLSAIVLGGCGGGGSAETHTSTATRPPPVRAAALCRRLTVTATGRVRSSSATELSGLALSRTQTGVLWTHNDSGDVPRILAISADGTLRAELRVTGADNVDWEDIALGRAPGGGGTENLYIADIGDNEQRRSRVVVYSVPEPRVEPGAGAGVARGATAAARRLVLRYPDGAHDAEALLVDPATDTLAIVTKSFDGAARVYVTARRPGRAVRTLHRAGTLPLAPGAAITAGDISADGATVVLRGYDRAYAFARRGAEPIGRALRRRPCLAGADLAEEGQGEALALVADGRAFYTVPEGARPIVRRYAPAPAGSP
jgi:hypothetical protein